MSLISGPTKEDITSVKCNKKPHLHKLDLRSKPLDSLSLYARVLIARE